MSSINLSRFIRTFVAVCICALLFVSNTFPALAANSNPTQGEDKLLGIERESQEIVQRKPMGLKETQEKASKGPNEVQGDADIDKMKNPSNTAAVSFEQQVKNLVEDVTGKEK